MRWWRELAFRLRRLDRRRAERELDEEIRAHLELETREHIEAGMSPEEARFAARRAFGNVARAKENSRAQWGFQSPEILWQDLRYGARMLRKDPGFTAVAVLTLAIGIGANSAIFSVVNGVMLRSLPHIDVDRWVYLWETTPPPTGPDRLSASGRNYRDWKEQSQSFEAIVAFMEWNYNLTGVDEPERLQSAIVSPEFFGALALVPAAGRTLIPEDAGHSARPVMISHGLWLRHFGGDTAIAGKTVLLNSVPHTIVGVAPRGFSFPPEAITDVWTPMPEQMYSSEDRSMRGLLVAAKLKPGVSPASARSEMETIARRLSDAYPENRGFGVALLPIRAVLSEELRPLLLALWGAAIFVLLLACVNVANLQLARLEVRAREIAVRAALGAGRAALLRQLLAESVVLALLGGGLGILAAPWGIQLLLALVPADVEPRSAITLDPTVLIASAAMLFATIAIFGLLPAVKASRANLMEVFRHGDGIAEGSNAVRARRAFIVVQLAFSFVPLVGAGLLIQSVIRLLDADPGFEPENRLTVSVSAPTARYREPADLRALVESLREELKSVPGVREVGLTSDLPFSPSILWRQAVSRENPQGVSNLAALPLVRYSVVSAGFFESLGIRVLSGRTFMSSDDPHGARVIIVNESLARNLFPGEDAVGKFVWAGHAESLPGTEPWEVVGVTGDVKMEGLGDEGQAAAYVPILQQESGMTVWRNLQVVVHTSANPSSSLTAIKERITRVAPDLAPANMSTLDAHVLDSAWRPRFAAFVLGLLSCAAVALAAVGVYGVTSYVVLKRTREIAIRMSLGAQSRDIYWLICARDRGPEPGGNRGVRPHALAFELAFRDSGIRPADLRGLGGASRRGRDDGLLPPGAAGERRRSGGGPALRVTRGRRLAFQQGGDPWSRGARVSFAGSRLRCRRPLHPLVFHPLHHVGRLDEGM
jgi:putative ABC transport system permease protein